MSSERFHGNVPKAHYSDSPLFRNCEHSNVNHYSPHAHPNESHNHKHINAFISQALTLIQNIIIHTWHLHRDDIQKYLYDCQRMHALPVLDKICLMSCDNLPVISFARVVPHIQKQSRLSLTNIEIGRASCRERV